MWIAEQVNSFLNLGICKEYPNMARSKSPSGGKANRSNKTSEQPGITTPVSNPEVSAVVAETASASVQPETKFKETKITPENRKFDVHKNRASQECRADQS